MLQLIDQMKSRKYSGNLLPVKKAHQLVENRVLHAPDVALELFENQLLYSPDEASEAAVIQVPPTDVASAFPKLLTLDTPSEFVPDV